MQFLVRYDAYRVATAFSRGFSITSNSEWRRYDALPYQRGRPAAELSMECYSSSSAGTLCSFSVWRRAHSLSSGDARASGRRQRWPTRWECIGATATTLPGACCCCCGCCVYAVTIATRTVIITVIIGSTSCRVLTDPTTTALCCLSCAHVSKLAFLNNSILWLVETVWRAPYRSKILPS